MKSKIRGTFVLGVWYNRLRCREMDEKRKRIKSRWRTWRRAQMLSQTQLARVGGVSRSTAQRWESEGSLQLPDVAQLVTICEGLRIKPDVALQWLIGGGVRG